MILVDNREYFFELQLTCLDGGTFLIVSGATFPEPDDPSVNMADVISMAGLMTRVPDVPVTKSERLTIRGYFRSE
jgi:hypothetical protein